ncbi:MAG TPA: hypothetical protein VF608_11655, partial [Thermoanaerobaculia bacterium]
MNGIVQSGGMSALQITPMGGAQVTLYEATSSTPNVIGTATSNADGTFTIATSSDTSTSIFYATATIGEGVTLMTIIGPALHDSITLNELTTISAAYCAAQFLVGAEIQGDSFALSIVAMMNANVVNIANGTSSAVLTSSPNADETNALRLTRSLGNFFATVVKGRELAMFYKLATPSSGVVPTNTIEALGNIARQPARNVGGIYLQSKTAKVYHPALESQPDAWTIAVKVNDSGNDDSMFGGPGNLAFDKQGRAWIANNVIQGSGVSTTWSIVLEPDGSAASISPFTGGGLLGPGFGVDVDADGNPWFGNFGWGNDFPNGGATQFNANAEPQSLPPDGYGAGVAYRVQGTLVDP